MIHFYYTHVLTLRSRLACNLAAIKARWGFFAGAGNKGIRHGLPKELVVSLTSYPPRFGTLDMSIKCLLQQTIRPDRIVLWVAEGDARSLPDAVRKLVGIRNFEIRTCDDIGPYKKIIPALSAFPDSFIATADDDLYYPDGWLEKLVDGWDGNYKSIVAHRAHRIKCSNDNDGDNSHRNMAPLPYSEWDKSIQAAQKEKGEGEGAGAAGGEGGSSPFIFATSGAGTLYPPGALDPRVTDRETFMKVCPKADDIWLYWMSRMNGSVTRKSSLQFELIEWTHSQDVALHHENVLHRKNDEKISAMIKKFGWIR